jgi:hypothetical protein
MTVALILALARWWMIPVVVVVMHGGRRLGSGSGENGSSR